MAHGYVPPARDDYYMIELILIDRTGERYFHIAMWWWTAIIGFIIALCTMSIAARYISLFLMAAGYAGMSTWNRIKALIYSHRFCNESGLGLQHCAPTACVSQKVA